MANHLNSRFAAFRRRTSFFAFSSTCEPIDNVSNSIEADEATSESQPAIGNADVVPSKYLFPFALVTSLFALWGFANDITNPLVKAFKDIFIISNQQSSLVQ